VSKSADDDLENARRGDVGAFELLVKSHQRSVYSLALRMLGSKEAADDLAQEVFLQMHLHLQTMESAAHLTHWVRRVVTHRAIDRLRSRPQFSLTSIDEEADIADSSPSHDPLLQQTLRSLLSELPSAARAVMLLRYQEDLDPLEIARTLEMPINTVKSHLKRSLASLRLRMGATMQSSVEELGYE
jgi:RNA polymerase sigma-70 factor, ECF subfamily